MFKMAQISNQSESSKAIKRINEQIAAINRTVGTKNNAYISAYSRAIREAGLEFSKDKGTSRYRIRNTAENRQKIAQAESLLKKYHAQTVGELRARAKAELEAEAAKEFTSMSAPKKETKKQRQRREKKYIKQKTSKAAIQKRIELEAESREIQNKLEVIYAATGSHELGQQLSDLTRGISPGQRNKGAVFDVFGNINEEFRRIQKGMLTEQEQRQAEDLAQIRNDFAFDLDDEDY